MVLRESETPLRTRHDMYGRITATLPRAALQALETSWRAQVPSSLPNQTPNLRPRHGLRSFMISVLQPPRKEKVQTFQKDQMKSSKKSKVLPLAEIIIVRGPIQSRTSLTAGILPLCLPQMQAISAHWCMFLFLATTKWEFPPQIVRLSS